MADSSAIAVPAGTSKESMLLLCDIFSTGFSCAHNARRLLDEDDEREVWSVKPDSVAVIFGCGPVGLCAISSALTMFTTVFATDPNPERRALAAKHGAIALPAEQLHQRVLEATEGRGADAALDLVGGPQVLNLCLGMIRSYGAVSSIGMQTRKGEIDYPLLYDKKCA
jgi:threonine dehydrogenase-like Zn-dependent dehydrogenase